jgi:hypothetical protein
LGWPLTHIVIELVVAVEWKGLAAVLAFDLLEVD